MAVEDSIIDHGTNVNIPSMPDNFAEKDQGRHTFLALVGAEVAGYDTDRAAFLGTYRELCAIPPSLSRESAPTRLPSATTPAARCKPISLLRRERQKSFWS